MSADPGLLALRTGVAFARLDHVARLRVTGEAAWDLVDRALPSDLFLRDGQARPSVMLDEQDRVIADVLVVREGDDLWLWTEGLPPEEVRRRLLDLARPGEPVTVEDETGATALLEVGGPFSWELMARFDEPGIVGQPYLTLARLDAGTRCVRAGRTGEYTYDLLVDRARVEAVEARLEELGVDLDLRRIGPETLDLASLESGFFVMGAEGRLGLTPAQLQLKCRISAEKGRFGRAPTRLTGLRGPRDLAAGDPVRSETGGELGRVVVAAPDPTGPGALGLALLAAEVAHAGLERLTVPAGPARTVSRPFVVQRSLSVKPQRDRYATRDRVPLAPGSWGAAAQTLAPPSTTSSAPTT